MALAVPAAYLVSAKTKTNQDSDEGEELYRLPDHHVSDLRAIATGVEESDAGVCCRYLIDQLTSESAPQIDEDGYEHQLEAAERFCERFGVWAHPTVVTWRRRIQRARRTIERMRLAHRNEAVNVLMVAFGHPDSLVRIIPELAAMRELGNLARYTEVVEERRLELARAEAARLEAQPMWTQKGFAFDDYPEWERSDRSSEMEFWRRHCYRRTGLATVTSADALRAALLPFSEPPAVRKPQEGIQAFHARMEARGARKKARRDSVGAFVTELRLQTSRMLSRAARAYHHTWLTTPPPSGYGEKFTYIKDVTKRVISAPVSEARVRGAGWSST